MIAELSSLLPEMITGLVPTPAPIPILLASILTFGAVVSGVVAVRARTKPRPNYGPGPRGIPILGNALELPTENDFLVYTSWARKWGA